MSLKPAHERAKQLTQQLETPLTNTDQILLTIHLHAAQLDALDHAIHLAEQHHELCGNGRQNCAEHLIELLNRAAENPKPRRRHSTL